MAGSGADAAPYFRIFNPTTQGEKFDPEGDYVRRWVHELAGIEGAAAHRPHDLGATSARVMRAAAYPAPIVDHPVARDCALEAFKRLKS